MTKEAQELYQQERNLFKEYNSGILDLTEDLDLWGRPKFKHQYVEASWLGWLSHAENSSENTRGDKGGHWEFDPRSPAQILEELDDRTLTAFTPLTLEEARNLVHSVRVRTTESAVRNVTKVFDSMFKELSKPGVLIRNGAPIDIYMEQAEDGEYTDYDVVRSATIRAVYKASVVATANLIDESIREFSKSLDKANSQQERPTPPDAPVSEPVSDPEDLLTTGKKTPPSESKKAPHYQYHAGSIHFSMMEEAAEMADSHQGGSDDNPVSEVTSDPEYLYLLGTEQTPPNKSKLTSRYLCHPGSVHFSTVDWEHAEWYIQDSDVESISFDLKCETVTLLLPYSVGAVRYYVKASVDIMTTSGMRPATIVAALKSLIRSLTFKESNRRTFDRHLSAGQTGD